MCSDWLTSRRHELSLLPHCYRDCKINTAASWFLVQTSRCLTYVKLHVSRMFGTALYNMYWIGSQFEYRPEHQFSWQVWRGFRQYFQENARMVRKIRPRPLPFQISSSSLMNNQPAVWRCVVWAGDITTDTTNTVIRL
jgi:hypothetical protein